VSIAASLSCPWSMATLRQDLAMPWSLPLAVDFSLPVGLSAVHAGLHCPWAMQAPVSTDCAMFWVLTSQVRAGFDAPHALAQGNAVQGGLLCPWALHDVGLSVAPDISATLGGRPLELLSMELSASEDACCISGVLEAACPADWRRATQGMELVLGLGAFSISLLVDDKTRTEEFGSQRLEIECRSPAGRLDAPLAAAITRTWENTTARAIAQELCDAAGITLQWKIRDWSVALFSVEQRTPLQIINSVSTEAAVLVSDFDGALVVQYRHPVSPTRYAQAIPALHIDDHEHVLRLWQETEYRPGYNAVDIVSGTTNSGEGLWIEEWSASPTGEHYRLAHWQRMVAVFAHPWRSVSLSASGCPVTIHDQGVLAFAWEESVEIKAGRGKLAYPAGTVLEFEHRCEDLGSITCQGREVSTSVPGYGMLRIRYRARCRRFLVESASMEKVQVRASATGAFPAAETAQVPLLARVVRTPGNNPAPGLVMDPLCTAPAIARQRGRNFLDEQGFNKLRYEAQTPLMPPVLPGAVASVGLTGFAESFRAKVTGWSLTAGADQTPTLAWDLERSLA
jgi:hypothetical protein